MHVINEMKTGPASLHLDNDGKILENADLFYVVKLDEMSSLRLNNMVLPYMGYIGMCRPIGYGF